MGAIFHYADPIAPLLDELEGLGVNVAELRKLYMSGRMDEISKTSMISLYRAIRLAKWLQKGQTKISE